MTLETQYTKVTNNGAKGTFKKVVGTKKVNKDMKTLCRELQIGHM
jgi:hypothetical protein